MCHRLYCGVSSYQICLSKLCYWTHILPYSLVACGCCENCKQMSGNWRVGRLHTSNNVLSEFCHHWINTDRPQKLLAPPTLWFHKSVKEAAHRESCGLQSVVAAVGSSLVNAVVCIHVAYLVYYLLTTI